MATRVLIIGGGFGGVTAAFGLCKQKLPDVSITLLSDRPCLEYYGSFYRLLAGKKKEEVCIPLAMLLEGKPVEISVDKVLSVDSVARTVKGEKKSYEYDILVLAAGSEPAYFGIPGMEQIAYNMKSVAEVHRLFVRVQEAVELMKNASSPDRAALGRFVIIGGGPAGIEAAGEILPYAKKLAQEKGMDPALIHVDLIEAMDRLLPILPPKISHRVLLRLRDLGVNVLLKSAVASVEPGVVHVKEQADIKAGTIVWTAGLKGNSLYAQIPGLETDKRGRVVVEETLHAKGHPEIFAVGDAAVTTFSGMAQTAVYDGELVAHAIASKLKNQPTPAYKPSAPAYAIPAGPLWAAVKFGPFKVFGLLGYMLRRAADIHVYMLLLPYGKIPQVFFGRTPLAKYGIK